MRLPFQRWATGSKFTYFLSGGALLTIGFVYVFLHLSSPKIKSKKDLQFFNGILIEHEYYHNSRGVQDCFFRLKGFSDEFAVGNKIKTFDISGFENLVNGDSVTVGLSKGDFARLNLGSDQIFIYALSSTNRIFLDYKDSIQKYNSNQVYYICALLLIFGFLLIYLGCISKVRSLI